MRSALRIVSRIIPAEVLVVVLPIVLMCALAQFSALQWVAYLWHPLGIYYDPALFRAVLDLSK